MTPEQFADKLRRVARELEQLDHSDTLQSCAAVVERSVRTNFSRKVRSDGVAWAARKVTIYPSEIRSRWNHPLLILTGRLINAASGGMGHYRKVGKKSMEMGVDPSVVPYARVHQDGGSSVLPNGRTITIPSRQYFYLHASDRPKLVRVIRDRTKVKVLALFGKSS